jgi:dTDP-4-dehydrorhamnose reductase
VYSGLHGSYSEEDAPDARDMYGKTKLLGEVDYPHAITLRTSTIGHELQSSYGLLHWFLAQKGQCKGYSRAKFSGLTNIEFSTVVKDFVISNPYMRGVYHVGGDCISKYELLGLISGIYNTATNILQDDEFIIDRSLDSSRFQASTGYSPPTWVEMIRQMHSRK